MTKTIKSEPNSVHRGSTPRFILLDTNEAWLEQFGRTRAVVCSDADGIRHWLRKATRNSVWISSCSDMTDELVRSVSILRVPHSGKKRPLGDLLMLESPRVRTLPILHSWFGNVIGEAPSFKTLPIDQLAEVLSASEEESRDIFVGGIVDIQSGMLALVRGNLARITAPLSIFRSSGTSTPNFRRFGLDDYGHTVRFGEYEAAADFILYEADFDYRRRRNAKRRAEEKGFGAALRRLRIQKGLSRDDFPGISAKTFARLERGEVEKPHRKTLRIISKALNVAPDEIDTY